MAVDIIDFVSDFKYKQEMYKLSELKCIAFKTHSHVITNKEYEEVIEPVYKWLLKYKLIHPEIEDELQIKFIEIDKELATLIYDIHTDLIIPSTFKNVVFDSTLRYNHNKIKIQNLNSLIISIKTYKKLLILICSEVLDTNLKLYSAVEQLGVTILKNYIDYCKQLKANKQEVKDFEKTKKYWEKVVATQLQGLVIDHMQLEKIEFTEELEMLNTIDKISIATYKYNKIQLNTYIENLEKLHNILVRLLEKIEKAG